MAEETEVEHAAWAAAAAEAGSGRLGTWVRTTMASLLTGHHVAPARPGPPPEVAALRAELARVDAAEAVMGQIREALRS